MDECEKMGFAQLKRFIHDAVERLSDPPSVANEELPRSREELLKLCDMLKEKADALKEDTPMPPRPTYDGPADPGFFFTPSRELDALYRKRRKAERRVDYEIKHGDSEIYLGYLKDELDEAEREIAPIEKREEQEYNERLREYQAAREPYRQRVRRWRAEVDKVEQQRDAEANRDEMVRRTYRRVKHAFESGATVPTREVHWRFLPPGEASNEDLLRHYDNHQRRNPNVRYDLDRIRKALSLGPNGRWVEREKFGDYIVFTFPFTSSALMECPIVGNAIYVLHSDPERWSGTPKQQLIAEADRGGEVARIPHQGDWFERVKRELGIE
jgi:hypothetical protein